MPMMLSIQITKFYSYFTSYFLHHVSVIVCTPVEGYSIPSSTDKLLGFVLIGSAVHKQRNSNKLFEKGNQKYSLTLAHQIVCNFLMVILLLGESIILLLCNLLDNGALCE